MSLGWDEIGQGPEACVGQAGIFSTEEKVACLSAHYWGGGTEPTCSRSYLALWVSEARLFFFKIRMFLCYI